ncbi:MAG: 50S ribosomal protein L24 [Elusimicrobia bacterium]|nr:50S ribosomal protein L24 [Elusimicrobiota bacterium]
MLKVKKKDKVIVLRGEDKGKKGEVLEVFPDKGRVLVSKINLVSKHTRPTAARPGGIQKKENPLPLASIMLICPKCDRPAKPRFDRLQTGEKVRICRRCGEVII